MSNAERQKFNSWFLEFDKGNKLNDVQEELMFIAWSERAKEDRRTVLHAQHHALMNERNLLAMQAAWIEQHFGKGAEDGMEWIESTLEGPGLIPDEEDEDFETSAQKYFDKQVEPIDKKLGDIWDELQEIAGFKP